MRLLQVGSIATAGGVMRELMAITKALADETRVRLLLALQGKQLCLCQLTELVQLAPPTVSRHMSILKQARLVSSHKQGRWMYYHLPGKDATPAVEQIIEWAFRCLTKDRRIAEDRARLKAILKIDPSELCDGQGRSARSSGLSDS